MRATVNRRGAELFHLSETYQLHETVTFNFFNPP